MTRTTFGRKAERRRRNGRIAISGPTGSGKTLTAIKIARGLAGDGVVGLVDTEHGTAEAFYADVTEFFPLELHDHQPAAYVRAIKAAADDGVDVLVIDSLSHAWAAVLDMVDAKGGQFQAWRHVTPHHNALVEAMLGYPGHLIVTLRSKMAYEVEEGGKRVSKLGLKPVQREGLEYEFDLVMDIDQAHRLTVTKSRVAQLADRVVLLPDEKFGAELAEFLGVGLEAPATDPRAAAIRGWSDIAALYPEHQRAVGAWLKERGWTSAADMALHAAQIVEAGDQIAAGPADPQEEPDGE